MRRTHKVMIAALSAGMLISIFSLNSFAATLKSITSVNLSFDSNIQVGDIVDVDAVEVTTKSSTYTVGEVEFENSGFSWDIDDVPELKIMLYAEDGYQFKLSKQSDVKLSGAGATASKSTKKVDNWTALEVYVKLTPLAQTVGEIEEAKWSSVGMASWSPVVGAGGYEVRLYRDGNGVGTTKVTGDTTYDFSSIMTKPAGYSFRVRAVNKIKTEIKSDYVESDMINVSPEQAALFRTGATAQGWKQDATGWWYQNADGSFTKENWQQIGDKWYYFNAQGYMMTGWVNVNGKMYYCAESGEMLVNTVTPDGHQVDASGARVDG